ncbi:MAG TPA: hypothetical protein VHO02_00020, partial [Fibrobacteria bacterium]|nr:hypothetical protein [Fibrobacteria bacterium]
MSRKISQKPASKSIPKRSATKAKTAKVAPKSAKSSSGKSGKVSAMWAGRFSAAMSPVMEKLSVSLHFDKKLFREDIEGSIAHAHGLHGAKV